MSEQPAPTAVLAPPTPGTLRTVRRLLDRLAPALLVVLATVALYGVWLSDEGRLTHEGIDPYARTEQLLVEVRAGNVPPQLLPDARGGTGSAFARYYPPVPFAVATTIAALTGGDAVLGVNLAFVVAALASGAAMGWSVRRLGGDRWAAAGTAIVYLAVPYHLFDVHVRGALGEAFAFVCLPLLFVGAWEGVARRRVAPALALGTAGLLLSHTISALLAGPVVGAVALVALARRDHGAVGRIVAAVGIGLALAAWFVVPQQVELGDVWASDADHMLATDADVATNAVGLADLIGDPGNGFRGYDHAIDVTSMGGPCWLFFCGADNLVLGPVTLALPLAALGTALLSRRRARGGHRATPGAGAKRADEVAASGIGADRWFAAVLAGGALGLLALVVWPTPLLRVLPAPVAYVQFPWRALAPVAAATSLLWFLVLRGSRHAGRTLVAVGLVAVALVPAAQRRPWTRPDITDACFTRADARAPADPVAGACFRAGGLGYLPDAGDEPSSRRGRAGRGWTTGNDYLPTDVDEHDPYAGVVAAPTVTAGSARVETWRRTGTGLVATVVADGSATVRLPATAYRFLRVGSDRGTLPRADADGTVAVRVPDGRTTITLGRRRTPAELAGGAITLLTVAGAAGLAVRRHRGARRARVLA